MNRITLLLTIAFSTSVAFSEEPLPADTKELIRKLTEFSEMERQKAEQRITEKRVQVAAVLETHLQRETKAGRLQSALAIQEFIQSLKDTAESNETESERMALQNKPEANAKPSLEENSRWRHVFNGGIGRTLVFENGKGRLEKDGGVVVTEQAAVFADDSRVEFLSNGLSFELEDGTKLLGAGGNIHWELIE